MADVMLAKPRAAAVIALENFMMLIFHGVITCGMRDLVVGGGLADGGLSIDFKQYGWWPSTANNTPLILSSDTKHSVRARISYCVTRHSLVVRGNDERNPRDIHGRQYCHLKLTLHV
jgi:hypothetical protein